MLFIAPNSDGSAWGYPTDVRTLELMEKRLIGQLRGNASRIKAGLNSGPRFNLLLKHTEILKRYGIRHEVLAERRTVADLMPVCVHLRLKLQLPRREFSVLDFRAGLLYVQELLDECRIESIRSHVAEDLAESHAYVSRRIQAEVISEDLPSIDDPSAAPITSYSLEEARRRLGIPRRERSPVSAYRPPVEPARPETEEAPFGSPLDD